VRCVWLSSNLPSSQRICFCRLHLASPSPLIVKNSKPCLHCERGPCHQWDCHPGSAAMRILQLSCAIMRTQVSASHQFSAHVLRQHPCGLPCRRSKYHSRSGPWLAMSYSILAKLWRDPDEYDCIGACEKSKTPHLSDYMLSVADACRPTVHPFNFRRVLESWTQSNYPRSQGRIPRKGSAPGTRLRYCSAMEAGVHGYGHVSCHRSICKC
jgi:hypothetical protein